MKLLIVTQAVDREDPNLGAFYYWFELMAKRASSLVIIAGRVGSHDFPSHVAVYAFGSARLGRIGRLWKFWELFSRHFADADAVLFHQIPEYVLAAFPFLLGRGKKAVVLWYAHGAVSWRLWLAERLADYIFTSSAAGFRLPSKKVIYMGQAINTELFRPIPPSNSRSSRGQAPSSALRMITIGRISPVKQYETLVAACALLQHAVQIPWTLCIIGGPLTDGDRAYAARLQAFVREKGLEEHIHFEGERPYSEIPGLLAGYDMFLNASRTGSLDKAVLEAMACGLMVLTSNEAYRAILPPPYFVEDPLPERFAERIVSLAREERPNEGLRGIVMRDHALASTIDRMAGLLFYRE